MAKQTQENSILNIQTPEMTKQLAALPKNGETYDEIALQAVLDRVEYTRSKKFSTRSIAELIEYSHMGRETEQFNIGIELEQRIRTSISAMIAKAFTRSDETLAMVNRVQTKVNNLDALYKTDSDRLTELARVAKQIDRVVLKSGE